MFLMIAVAQGMKVATRTVSVKTGVALVDCHAQPSASSGLYWPRAESIAASVFFESRELRSHSISAWPGSLADGNVVNVILPITVDLFGSLKELIRRAS
jgi:hypothetical protein